MLNQIHLQDCLIDVHGTQGKAFDPLDIEIAICLLLLLTSFHIRRIESGFTQALAQLVLIFNNLPEQRINNGLQRIKAVGRRFSAR